MIEKTQETTRDRFSLEKVKKVRNGGLDLHFEIIDIEGEETFRDKEHKTSTKEAHPDLISAIDVLKPFLAKIYQYDFMSIISSRKDYDASAKQLEIVERAYDEVLKSIEITGISIRGTEGNIAVVITGTKKAYQNIQTAINSPLIRLNQEIYGFENDIEDLIKEIENEVYLYLYEGKRAQLSLFGEKKEGATDLPEPADGQKELPKERELKGNRKEEPQKQETTV